SNYTGKIIYKKNFYIHRTNNGYRFSKSDSNNTSYFFDLNNLTSQDIPYFLFQLSKDKVNALRNDHATLFSAFYIDNLPLAKEFKGEIHLTPLVESNTPNTDPDYPVKLKKPVMAQSGTFYGKPY